jgi:hypothetical protein
MSDPGGRFFSGSRRAGLKAVLSPGSLLSTDGIRQNDNGLF